MGFQVTQVEGHVQTQLIQQGVDGVTHTVQQQGQLLLKQRPLPNQNGHQKQQEPQERQDGQDLDHHHSHNAWQTSLGQSFQTQHQGMQDIRHDSRDHERGQHRRKQPKNQDYSQGHAQPGGQAGHQKWQGCLQVDLVVCFESP